MDAIMEIAERHNLVVIEECAHAHGAKWRGRGAGTTELRFIASHDPRRARPQPPTEITLKLAAPERDARRLGANCSPSA